MYNVIPQEGCWYAYRGSRELYQVINIDDVDRVIYFQDTRGDIDEVDFDEWYAMDLELLTDLGDFEQFADDDEEPHPEADRGRSQTHTHGSRR